MSAPLPPPLRVCAALPSSPLATAAQALFARELAARGGPAVAPAAPDAAVLRLTLDRTLAAESFAVRNCAGGALELAGGDERGLLYGVGWLLRALAADGAWRLPAWRGTQVPTATCRGLYAAHNFNNWYHAAPLADLTRYLEDLALWGCNTLVCNFASPELAAPLDDAARERLARYHAMIRAADALGMRVGLLLCANCSCPPGPPAARATRFPDADPPRRGWDDSFVCPSHPAGRRHLTDWFRHSLELFAGLPLQSVVSFPYDAGGCGCAQCWPWGARGYLAISRELSRLAKERFPRCQFILGCWCFDVRDESDGEFAGLAQELRRDRSWVDALMVDAHETFPAYPLEHGVPGGLPMISFPEITMWGRYPWGGSGANPYPGQLAANWQRAGHLLAGGLPYSEGCFTDLNQVCCLRWFWDRATTADDSVRQYAAWHFHPTVAADVAAAVRLLEADLNSAQLTRARAEAALALLSAADCRLPPAVRASWRWRVLYLRAVIDAESVRSPAAFSVPRNAAGEELTRLYAAARAGAPVAPRCRSYYARSDVTLAPPHFAEA